MKIKSMSWALLLALVSPLHAQITIEHVYSKGSSYNNMDPDTSEYWLNQSAGVILLNGTSLTATPLINLSNGGYKYVRISVAVDYNTYPYQFITYQLKFYDLNHSLWKTIELAPVINNLANSYTCAAEPTNVLYISDKLFDTDNDIEFIWYHQLPANPTCGPDFFYLFDETTMNVSNIAGLNPDSIESIRVYNTPNGAKLILSYGYSYYAAGLGKDYVLSLPGTYPPQPVIVKENNIGIEQANPFPNPANKQITLPYSLPAHKTGELIIYDMQGKEIKKFKIDNAFNNILLNTSELNNGMYIYKVQCDGEVILTKKFVISN